MEMVIYRAAAGDEEQKICRMKRGSWKCKSVSVDNEIGYCEKHYKDFTTKKKMKEKELPPDENRCCQTSNRGAWRCRNFRMGRGTSAAATDDKDSFVPKTKFCEKHYYDYAKYYKNRLLKMKKSGDGEGSVAGCGAAGGPIETRASKRRKKVTEEDDRSVDDTGGIQPATCDDTSDTNVEGRSANINGRKGENVERTEGFGKLAPLTRTKEPVVETRDHSNFPKEGKEVTGDEQLVDETRVQLATNDTCDSDRIVEGGSANIGRNLTNFERTEGCSREQESLTRIRELMVELESLDHYKSKCFQLSMDLEKMRVELEKKKVECTTLRVKSAEVETRKTAATDETEQTTASDAIECCRKMMSDFESRLLRMENENSTLGCLESWISNLERLNLRMENENLRIGCAESRISNLESLVLRSGKESSILR